MIFLILSLNLEFFICNFINVIIIKNTANAVLKKTYKNSKFFHFNEKTCTINKKDL